MQTIYPGEAFRGRFYHGGPAWFYPSSSIIIAIYSLIYYRALFLAGHRTLGKKTRYPLDHLSTLGRHYLCWIGGDTSIISPPHFSLPYIKSARLCNNLSRQACVIATFILFATTSWSIWICSDTLKQYFRH
jgi:hypothetical protein